MKKALLTTLRDKTTSRDDFRLATEQISMLLAGEAGIYLRRNPVKIATPLVETEGERVSEDIVVIPILRAGLAMLPAFLRYYPHAAVGFFGMRRDEVTKKPHLYYSNIPRLKPDTNVILIDPMIATGGSGILALEKVLSAGVKQENIIYVGIIAAPEGLAAISRQAPAAHFIVAARDEKLNADAFIVPGIGDFGDRYFGTEQEGAPK